MKAAVADRKGELISLLQHRAAGAENAMPLADLAGLMDLDWRGVAKLLHACRQEGWLIGTSRSSDHPGAFWPVTPDDQAAALRPYAHALGSMARVYNRLRRRVPRNIVMGVERDVQLELFEE